MLEEALVDRDNNAKELQVTKERIRSLEDKNIEYAEEIASVSSVNRDLNT